MTITVYRIQDSQGAGPWLHLPQLIYEAIGYAAVAHVACMNIFLILNRWCDGFAYDRRFQSLAEDGEIAAWGCPSEAALMRIFPPYIHPYLEKRGFCAYEIEADRFIVAKGCDNNEIIFMRRKPLNVDIMAIPWPKDESVSQKVK